AGAVLYGDTLDGSWYVQLLKDKTDISHLRDNLIFGQAHVGDSGVGAARSASGLPDDAEICGCNGVCKGTIVKAIRERNLLTLDDVRAHTKASSSCGSCTGLVEDIIASCVGADYTQTPKTRPMCPCTDYTHEEVRRTIVSQGLKDIAAVRHFLDWKQPDGCEKCRP